MFVASPTRLLDVFLVYDDTGWSMKTGTIDQSGLKGLKLLAGDNVIVNIDDHDASFLFQ
jgi:hypothetical protein